MNNISHINLWQTAQPLYSNGITTEEIYDSKGILEVTNITKPELIIYSPQKTKNKGIAVIICPGGAYAGLAISLQGYDFAEWLASIGITGIVLKYRMPNGHKEVPLEDVKESLKYVCRHATQFSINSNKIGIAGFSAGGHLAAMASNKFSLDIYHFVFSILFYPVITMKEYTHYDSKINLLSNDFTEKDIQEYSCEDIVTDNTPKTLIFVSDDDSLVSPVNSTIYYNALKKHNISANLYIFPQGDHAWGIKGKNVFGKDFKNIDIVKTILYEWLLTLFQ